MCSPLIIVVQKKGLLCIGVVRNIKSDGHLSRLATVSPASKWDNLPLYMFLLWSVLVKLNSKVPDERQEQRDPHYREADMKSVSWSHEQFSPPVSLLTEPVRGFPTDPLLQWMNPSALAVQAQQLRGAVEHWGVPRGFLLPSLCRRELWEEAAAQHNLLCEEQNKSFRTSTVHHLGKKWSLEARKRVTNFSSTFQNNSSPFLQATVSSSSTGQRVTMKCHIVGRSLCTSLCWLMYYFGYPHKINLHDFQQITCDINQGKKIKLL